MTETEESVVVSVTVNGTAYRGTVESRLHLADFLRHVVGLTGTHLGCEQGVCGMCTVLLDGLAVKSCIVLAAQADGHGVTTVESLSRNRELSHLAVGLQRAPRAPVRLLHSGVPARDNDFGGGSPCSTGERYGRPSPACSAGAPDIRGFSTPSSTGSRLRTRRTQSASSWRNCSICVLLRSGGGWSDERTTACCGEPPASSTTTSPPTCCTWRSAARRSPTRSSGLST